MNAVLVIPEAKPTPRPDQIADLAFFINNSKAGLLHDPGVGKTITAAIFTEYRINYLNEKAVWIQPTSIMKKNKDELLRFTDLKDEDVVIVDGPPERRRQRMLGPGKVWLMTAAGFSAHWETLFAAHPDIKLNICDEFHLMYAGHNSKRTQSWYVACRRLNSVIVMSGTLIKGKLSTVYPMLHVVAPLYYGSFEAFMAQHAIVDDYGRVCGWMNHEKLKNVLGAVSIRRSFESVYGESHPVVQVELCDMAPKIRKEYDKLAAKGIIELENSFLEADTPGLLAIRCRQIMAHPETMEMAGPDDLTGKDERMMIHVQDHVETGERLVIFAALIPEQERICRILKNLGLKVALINGTVSGAHRQQIDEDFRAGKLQFIVGSAATMGVGFNWPFLRMVLFASLDYGDDTFSQSYKRAIRGVREHALLVIVLEYRNSVDQRIFRVIEEKAKNYTQVDETKPEIFLRAAKDAKAKTPEPGRGLKMEDV